MPAPVIGLATTQYSCFDPRSWSGLPYSMYQGFRRRDDVATVPLGPLKYPPRIPEALRKARAHPEWSALNGGRRSEKTERQEAVAQLAAQLLEP